MLIMSLIKTNVHRTTINIQEQFAAGSAADCLLVL